MQSGRITIAALLLIAAVASVALMISESVNSGSTEVVPPAEMENIQPGDSR
jgi:hypothetical protein